jgi:hypothetical protein
MSLQRDLEMYIEGLESPANAWGVHHIKVGNVNVDSHSFLHYMIKRYGTAAVENALDDRLAGGKTE